MPREELRNLLPADREWPRSTGRSLIGLPLHLRGRKPKPPQKRPSRVENVSPSLRFRILARDRFSCQYCGRSAPEVKLQVDHILPVAGGGTNDPKNLATACAECNIGKGSALINGMGLLP